MFNLSPSRTISLSSIYHKSFSLFSLLKQSPVVFIDIDGVLKLGKKPIPNAKKGLELLRKYNIPFQIVTNDGGNTEISRARVYSSILNLSTPFTYKDITLSHSPMQSVLSNFSKKDTDKIPLIVGRGNVSSLMSHYNVKRYITVKEYASIFYKMLPRNIIRHLIPISQKMTEKLSKRLSIKIDPDKPLGINGIFQISDVLRWEVPIQLICDLMISKDGYPGSVKGEEDPFSVEYHTAFDDYEYKDQFVLPRYCGGGCIKSAVHLFKMMNGYPFPYTVYGKPSKKAFEYAKNKIKKYYPNIKASNYYMIGDNPRIDIKGANENGITSILVRTGVFNGKNNDEQYPAKVVLKDFYSAVKYILSKEKII